VTARQVQYWAQQGHRSHALDDPTRFHRDAVDRSLLIHLIHQGLDQGASLRAAGTAAQAYWADQLCT
jgi:hypothetical protein